MAKIVIAGCADCPYYARAELLGDRLAKNLPDFNLHKIVKRPDDWEDWLQETCQEKQWVHKKSPLVWRELIDRGGKGVLIGGANEFQEYACGYYGLSSELDSDDMRNIAAENLETKNEVDLEKSAFKSLSNPMHVCITNASSNMCYGMINSIAKGDVFGQNTEISLHLLDSDNQMEYLAGLEMEVNDLAHGLLREVMVTPSPYQAFSQCSAIILLDEITRDPDGKKSDWLKKNAEHFSNYAKIIDEVSHKNVKVLVAGNGPVNFNTFILTKNASNIPRQNFAGVSRIVENHAKAIIAERLKVNSVNVVDVLVWGNTNDSHYVDLSKARVHEYDGAIWGPPSYSVPALEMIHDNKWVEGEFPALVKERRQKIEALLGHASTVSQASAVSSMAAHWWNGSPSGQIFSMAVVSEGWYGVPEGMVFSYPMTLSPKGYWNVVQDIDLNDDIKDHIHTLVEELQVEMNVIYPPPHVPSPPPTESKKEEEAPGVTSDRATEGKKDMLSEDVILEEPENEAEEGGKQQDSDPGTGKVFGETA